MNSSKASYNAIQDEEHDDQKARARKEADSVVGGSEVVKNMSRCLQAVKSVVSHGVYFCLCAACILFLKYTMVDTNSDSYLALLLCGINFAKLYVTALGIGFPMLLSLRALVTLETDDDRYWLTYWAVYGTYTLFTILIEEVLFEDTWLWYAIQGSAYVWLYFPGLHGCLLVSRLFLKPFLLPLIYRVSSWVKEKITLKVLLGSMFNLGFVLALIFFLIPFCSTYIGTTLVGICYPLLKSVELISKHDMEDKDDGSDGAEARGSKDKEKLKRKQKKKGLGTRSPSGNLKQEGKSWKITSKDQLPSPHGVTHHFSKRPLHLR